MSFLTVVRISPAQADLRIPKIKFFPDEDMEIKTYPTSGRFVGGSVIHYSTFARSIRKRARVFETPSQILVARSSTDINAQDKATSLTAAGTNQGTALDLTKYYNQIDTAASGTGVKLDAAVKGKVRVVQNDGANDIIVYPASGEYIQGNAVNVGVTLTSGQRAHFGCYTAGTWVQAIFDSE